MNAACAFPRRPARLDHPSVPGGSADGGDGETPHGPSMPLACPRFNTCRSARVIAATTRSGTRSSGWLRNTAAASWSPSIWRTPQPTWRATSRFVEVYTTVADRDADATPAAARVGRVEQATVPRMNPWTRSRARERRFRWAAGVISRITDRMTAGRRAQARRCCLRRSSEAMANAARVRRRCPRGGCWRLPAATAAELRELVGVGRDELDRAI